MMAAGIMSSRGFGSSKAMLSPKSQGTLAEGASSVPLLAACLVQSLLFALAAKTLTPDFQQGAGLKKNGWTLGKIALSAGDFSQGVLFALALTMSGAKPLHFANDSHSSKPTIVKHACSSSCLQRKFRLTGPLSCKLACCRVEDGKIIH